MCSPQLQKVSTTPASGSTIHATPDRDEQGGDLVGDEDADAEADQRPQAEHEQAQRERAERPRRSGTARSPRALSTIAPAMTEPTSEISAVDGADAEQGDDLGAPSPAPAAGCARKVLVIVLWRYSEPICMTPMVSVSR